ncbi:unnamed protein product [Darwinula stevensoni]|uniref:START domain-containing protein n=1 Tax=Darwinula stevensoni TaxID=69355 RepID=A0A7R8XCS4_9CRUS|nr:unnamed protein product [Darwinula stevensoni]CAG0892503.1 unnamed protein product [Darwinula stevensoni]
MGPVARGGRSLDRRKRTTGEMKTIFIVELIVKTMHFLQDAALLCQDGLASVNSSVAQIHQSWKEKCEEEGEKAQEKLHFNLERRNWTLERECDEEGITVKYARDPETNTYFLLTEVPLDLELEWVAQDMRYHTLAATAEWNSDSMEFTILERMTHMCWVAYQATPPKLGGIIASRDMVIYIITRFVNGSYFVSTSSTEWPGMEPREDRVRADMQKGGGFSLSPDPAGNGTRLRWVSTLDFNIPLISRIVPMAILRRIYVEGSRNYIAEMKKYLMARRGGRGGRD